MKQHENESIHLSAFEQDSLMHDLIYLTQLADTKIILFRCSSIKILKNYSSTNLPVPTPIHTTWFVP